MLKKRNIIVDNYNFIYSVKENLYNIIYRVYSGEYKSTYCEIIFNWESYFGINLYLPGVSEILIRFFIKNGWVYGKEKQVLNLNELIYINENFLLLES